MKDSFSKEFNKKYKNNTKEGLIYIKDKKVKTRDNKSLSHSDENLEKLKSLVFES